MQEASKTFRPRFPGVKLSSRKMHGHHLGVLSAVTRALKDGGVATGDIEAFCTEALQGDYDHTLKIAVQWVDIGA